jgi:hypothetical protein
VLSGDVADGEPKISAPWIFLVPLVVGAGFTFRVFIKIKKKKTEMLFKRLIRNIENLPSLPGVANGLEGGFAL